MILLSLLLLAGALSAQEKTVLQAEGRDALTLAQELKNGGNLPECVVLINPEGFTETEEGTVFPKALPPKDPAGCHLVMVLEKDCPDAERHAALQYMKTWKGWDGNVMLIGTRDSISVALDKVREPQGPDVNPAIVPVEGWARERHEEKARLLRKNRYKVIFLGDSIMNNMEKEQYRPVWDKYYGGRKALNLGTSAYRTENLLWELDNFDLRRQHPKVCILGIGTNNVDEKNYPYRCTAGELAEGIGAVVQRVRTIWPRTKIVILACFPGSYDGQLPTSHRLILEKASDLAAGLADGKHVFFCDVNSVFLNADGSLRADRFTDWLHPSVEGAEAWFAEMEPLVSRLLGTGPISSKQPYEL